MNYYKTQTGLILKAVQEFEHEGTDYMVVEVLQQSDKLSLWKSVEGLESATEEQYKEFDIVKMIVESEVAQAMDPEDAHSAFLQLAPLLAVRHAIWENKDKIIKGLRDGKNNMQGR